MSKNKVLIVLGIIILLTFIGVGLRFMLQPTEEISKAKPTTTQETKERKTNKIPQETVESDHNAATMETQLKHFIPLFYNASYANSNDDQIENYVTIDFLSETKKHEDNHLEYEDKDYAIRISGLSFFVPLTTQIESENKVKVLTSFNTSIRSSGSPEVNRPILVEITMVYSDTWRVNHIEDKSSLSQGGA